MSGYVGKKTLRRHEEQRKHGNAAWAPCKPCLAYGAVNNQKCSACGGIGFVPRSGREYVSKPQEKA